MAIQVDSGRRVVRLRNQLLVGEAKPLLWFEYVADCGCTYWTLAPSLDGRETKFWCEHSTE